MDGCYNIKEKDGYTVISSDVIKCEDEREILNIKEENTYSVLFTEHIKCEEANDLVTQSENMSNYFLTTTNDVKKEVAENNWAVDKVTIDNDVNMEYCEDNDTDHCDVEIKDEDFDYDAPPSRDKLSTNNRQAEERNEDAQHVSTDDSSVPENAPHYFTTDSPNKFCNSSSVVHSGTSVKIESIKKKAPYIRPYRVCPFCQKFKSKLSNHILHVHRDEGEVKEIMKKNIKERHLFLDKLKKRGILEYNKSKVNGNFQDCIKERKSVVNNNREMVMCINCLGFYSSICVSRHFKICTEQLNAPASKISLDLLKDIPNVDNDEFAVDVLSKFRSDKIGILCKNNDKIIYIGRKLWAKSGKRVRRKRYLRRSVMTNMRRLAALYLEFKATDSTCHLSANESDVTDSTCQLSANESDVTDSTCHLSVNESNVTDSTCHLSVNESDVTDSTCHLSANESDVTDSTCHLSANESNVTDSTCHLSANESDVTDSTCHLSANESDVTDMFDYTNFQNLELALENVTRCSDGYSKSGLKMQYYQLINNAAKIIKCLWIIKQDEDKAKKIDRFLTVFKRNSRCPKPN